MPNTDTRPMSFEEFLHTLSNELKGSAPITEEVPAFSIPDIETTVFNGDTTIVIWQDGKKTIVTKEQDKPYDPYAAFCAAVCKRLFGGTDKVMRVIERTDKASIARKKAEAAALQKAKNRAIQEELHRKAEERRKQEDKELMDALVEHYFLEEKARKRAQELLSNGLPFDATREEG